MRWARMAGSITVGSPGGGERHRRLCDEVAAALRGFDPSQLSGAERFVFWINVYNALVIQASVEFDLRARIDELGGLDAFFIRAAYNVGGHPFSLDDIEYLVLRANRGHGRSRGTQFGSGDPRTALCLPEIDPRIHFVLHCGAAICPVVGVLEAANLDEQLDEVARAFLQGEEGASFDARTRQVVLPAFMRWNADDFGARRRCCRSCGGTWKCRTRRAGVWATGTTTGGWARPGSLRANRQDQRRQRRSAS